MGANKRQAVTVEATFTPGKYGGEGQKRHYLPGWKLTWTCPACGNKNTRDLGDDYLSHPNIDAPTTETLTCYAELAHEDDGCCEHEVGAAMTPLKTTPEERAALRESIGGYLTYNSFCAESFQRYADDLDTLAAEVGRYRNALRDLLRHADATYPIRKRVDIGHQAPPAYHLSAAAYAHITELCRAANISSDQDDE